MSEESTQPLFDSEEAPEFRVVQPVKNPGAEPYSIVNFSLHGIKYAATVFGPPGHVAMMFLDSGGSACIELRGLAAKLEPWLRRMIAERGAEFWTPA